MPEIITSSANPLIKQARSLHQKKARDESGLFLVEGILHVGEAFEAGSNIDAILYCQELLTSDFAQQLIKKAALNGVNCQPVSVNAFESLSGKENPQGIAAIVQQKRVQLEQLEIEHNNLWVAAVTPQDPGNIGAILRSIDAVGADGLILVDGGVDVFHPSAVRASMGTHFWKPIVQTSFAQLLAWVKQNQLTLIGTSARGSVDYLNLSVEMKPTVLLLGSEQKGLSQDQLSACDQLVRLPMKGRVSSLNLAVAAGILLYRLSDLLGERK